MMLVYERFISSFYKLMALLLFRQRKIKLVPIDDYPDDEDDLFPFLIY